MNEQHRTPNEYQTHNHLLQWWSPLAAWINDYQRELEETMFLDNIHCTELSISSSTTKNIQLSFSHANPVTIYLSCWELHHFVCSSGNPLNIYIWTDQPSQLIVEGQIARFAILMDLSEEAINEIDHDDPLESTENSFRFDSSDLPTATQIPKLWRRIYVVDINHIPPGGNLNCDDLILCDASTLHGTCAHVATCAFLVMHSAKLAQVSAQAQRLRLESHLGVMLIANPELALLEVNSPHLTLVDCHEITSISSIDQAFRRLNAYHLESLSLVQCSAKYLELALATASLTLTGCEIQDVNYQRAVNVQLKNCSPLRSIQYDDSQICADTRSLFASTLPAAINELTYLGYECSRSIRGCIDEYIDSMSMPDNPLIAANIYNPISMVAMLFTQSGVCPKARWRARTTIYESMRKGSACALLPWFWSPSQLRTEVSTNKYWLQKNFNSDPQAAATNATNHDAGNISSDTIHTFHLIDFILWANAYTAGCPQAATYKASIVQGLRLHQHGFYGLRLLAHALEHFPEILSPDSWRDLVNSAASAIDSMTKASSVNDENALLVLLHQYMRMLVLHLDADALLNPYYVAPIFDLLIHEIYHTFLPYHRLAQALQQINPALYEQIYRDFRYDYDNLCSSPEIDTLD